MSVFTKSQNGRPQMSVAALVAEAQVKQHYARMERLSQVRFTFLLFATAHYCLHAPANTCTAHHSKIPTPREAYPCRGLVASSGHLCAWVVRSES